LKIIATILSLCAISFLVYGTSAVNFTVYAQSYIQIIKQGNLVIDLGNGVKTSAQLTYPAVGKGPFPGVLLVHGAGPADMNYSGGYIRIDNKTGSKIYPPTIFFQIAQYLSERGFAVLRYDKRGIGANLTTVDSNVWENMTYNDLVQDAQKALNVLIHQPEVNPNKISIIGHSEGGETVTRIAIDNPAKIRNLVLLDARIQTARDALHYGFIDLPLEYAKQVLDKNHNGSISLQEASQDQIFQGMVGGNISSQLLTQSNFNDTKLLKSKYSPNNDINININTELKPILEKRSENLLNASKCENPHTDTCPTYLRSLLNLNSTLSIIGNVPSSTRILMLHGQNDSGSPIQQAFLLQQRLTELNYHDHTLIIYPNLGHTLYPSSQWQTSSGPIPSYVLADLYSWLEAHSGFTRLRVVMPSSNPSSSSSTTTK
jgi:pimeloyl-ACP methyl ester carboxylesterase